MATVKKAAKKSKSSAKVRDLKPKKNVKGGLLPAVGPARSLNFSRSIK